MSRVIGWLPLAKGRKRPGISRYPLRQNVPMSKEMMSFILRHADELRLAGFPTSRAEIVRECISRIAWDYFGEDIE